MQPRQGSHDGGRAVWSRRRATHRARPGSRDGFNKFAGRCRRRVVSAPGRHVEFPVGIERGGIWPLPTTYQGCPVQRAAAQGQDAAEKRAGNMASPCGIRLSPLLDLGDLVDFSACRPPLGLVPLQPESAPDLAAQSRFAPRAESMPDWGWHGPSIHVPRLFPRHKTLASFPPPLLQDVRVFRSGSTACQPVMRKPSACSTCRYVVVVPGTRRIPGCRVQVQVPRTLLANHRPGHDGANAYTQLQTLALGCQHANIASRVGCDASRRLLRVATTPNARRDSRKPQSSRPLPRPQNSQRHLPAIRTLTCLQSL
jgi:hypothetical protein